MIFCDKLIISLEVWSNYGSTEHRESESEKLQVYLVELEEKLVFPVKTQERRKEISGTVCGIEEKSDV